MCLIGRKKGIRKEWKRQGLFNLNTSLLYLATYLADSTAPPLCSILLVFFFFILLNLFREESVKYQIDQFGGGGLGRPFIFVNFGGMPDCLSPCSSSGEREQQGRIRSLPDLSGYSILGSTGTKWNTRNTVSKWSEDFSPHWTHNISRNLEARGKGSYCLKIRTFRIILKSTINNI